MPRGEVLVAIVNNPEDMRLALEAGGYRIPVASVRKWLQDCWPPHWLAFYQTKVFGPEAHAINLFGLCHISAPEGAFQLQTGISNPRLLRDSHVRRTTGRR